MTYQNRTNKDWKFSDKVHQHVLDTKIYNNTFLELIDVEKASKKEDQNEGIDYFAVCKNSKYSVQERFRELSKYTENSFEFTLRYERNNSLINHQKKSEFFKIKANYLLYGITENKKSDIEISRLKRFVFINLEELYKEINNGKIIIDENKKNRLLPYVDSNKIPYAIVKHNHEDKSGNSSLVIFNVLDLYKINKKIVFSSSGYLKEDLEKKINNKVKSPLSNLYPSKFVYKEFTFISNEQFIIFSKAKTFKDEETAKKILDVNNEPIIQDFFNDKITKEDIANNEFLYEQWKKIMIKVRQFGKEVKNINEEKWNKKFEKVSFFGSKEKFKQNIDLKDFLMKIDENYLVGIIEKDKLLKIQNLIKQLKEALSLKLDNHIFKK